MKKGDMKKGDRYFFTEKGKRGQEKGTGTFLELSNATQSKIYY